MITASDTESGRPSSPSNCAARDGKSRFQVQYFELEGPGAKADLVARDLRTRVWDASFGRQTGYGAFAWQGVWGGLPDAAGHTVRYARDAVKMSVASAVGRASVPK